MECWFKAKDNLYAKIYLKTQAVSAVSLRNQTNVRSNRPNILTPTECRFPSRRMKDNTKKSDNKSLWQCKLVEAGPKLVHGL